MKINWKKAGDTAKSVVSSPIRFLRAVHKRDVLVGRAIRSATTQTWAKLRQGTKWPRKKPNQPKGEWNMLKYAIQALRWFWKKFTWLLWGLTFPVHPLWKWTRAVVSFESGFHLTFDIVTWPAFLAVSVAFLSAIGTAALLALCGFILHLPAYMHYKPITVPMTPVIVITVLLFASFFLFLWTLPENKEGAGWKREGNDEDDERQDGDYYKVAGPSKLMTLAWGGFTLPIYLRTGRYKRLGGFSPVLKVVAEFTDQSGSIEAQVPFQVWDNAGASKDPNRAMISALAGNSRAKVWLRGVTAVLEPLNPRRMLKSSDPALAFGEAMREVVRDLAVRFVDTDLSELHQKIGDILRGAELITYFWTGITTGRVNKRTHSAGRWKVGAMLRSAGDVAMYDVIPLGSTAEERAEIIVKFQQRVLAEGDKAMKDGLGFNGKIKGKAALDEKLSSVRLRSVEEAAAAIGYKVEQIIVGEVILSDAVQQAANEASAEEQQRTGQIRSAMTAKEVLEIQKPKTGEYSKTDELNRLIQAAADNPDGVKVVGVVGSAKDNLGAAIVAAVQNK